MDDSTIICRCEEVTYGEIKKALELGLVSPGDVRRYTRAGMGACQGRACQRVLMQIIKKTLGSEDIPEKTITPRSPVRAVTLGELAIVAGDEDH